MTLPVPQKNQETLEAALRQEAAFRVQAIRDFRDLEARLREQQATIDTLNRTIGEKDTYIHTLHLEAQKHNDHLAAVRRDVEQYAFFARRLRRDFAGLTTDWVRAAVKWIASFDTTARHSDQPLPGAGDVYHLEPSPYRVFTAADFRLTGWVRPAPGKSIALLRARIGDQTFRPSAPLAPVADPTQSAPIDIALNIPPGMSLLRLEVADTDGQWRSLVNAPLWRPQA
ncbi:MAG: hypothetical protein SFV32_09005 [Opitutaceae bacterium]|nr:hypothetical protein [Opitutaceae bacterium]